MPDEAEELLSTLLPELDWSLELSTEEALLLAGPQGHDSSVVVARHRSFTQSKSKHGIEHPLPLGSGLHIVGSQPSAGQSCAERHA